MNYISLKLLYTQNASQNYKLSFLEVTLRSHERTIKLTGVLGMLKPTEKKENIALEGRTRSA